MNDQNDRYARLRHTVTGALAALAVVGAIAGTAALAAKPRPNTDRRAAVTKGSPTKTPTSPVPDKTHAPQPAVNQQPFLNAIQQLVDNGTITAAESQTVDSEIQTGTVDTDTLASSGFTPSQVQAVNQALGTVKRSLGRTAPPPPLPGKNSTPQQDAKRRHA